MKDSLLIPDLYAPTLRSDAPKFDGETFAPEHDADRLGRQMAAVKALMADGVWRTLAEIALETGAPEASVSARLRDFRKDKFGSLVIERRRRGDPSRGLWEYRMVTPD